VEVSRGQLALAASMAVRAAAVVSGGGVAAGLQAARDSAVAASETDRRIRTS